MNLPSPNQGAVVRLPDRNVSLVPWTGLLLTASMEVLMSRRGFREDSGLPQERDRRLVLVPDGIGRCKI